VAAKNCLARVLDVWNSLHEDAKAEVVAADI
jgi:hypothetical protein